MSTKPDITCVGHRDRESKTVTIISNSKNKQHINNSMRYKPIDSTLSFVKSKKPYEDTNLLKMEKKQTF